MKIWTKQEYYDRLYEAAYDGTFPSYDVGMGRCVYRGTGKARCAIGILLPDASYCREMDIFAKKESKLAYVLDRCEQVEDLAPDDYSQTQQCHDRIVTRYAHEGKWDAAAFIDNLNLLAWTSGVKKKAPKEEPVK